MTELAWKKKDEVRKVVHDNTAYIIKPKGDEFRVYVDDHAKSVFRGSLDLCKQYVQNLVNTQEATEEAQATSEVVEKYADMAWKYGSDWHLLPKKKRNKIFEESGLTKNQITDHVVRTADRRVDTRMREKFREQNLSNRKLICVLNGSLCLQPGDVPKRSIYGWNVDPQTPEETHDKPKAKGPVKRDAFGAKIGTGAASINAALSSKWKTATTIQKEAETDRNVTSHLASLVKEGKVVKKRSSKSGQIIYRLSGE